MKTPVIPGLSAAEVGRRLRTFNLAGLRVLLDGTYQALHADLTDLVARWVAASASGPASLDFAEDTDNGTNKITLAAPASLVGDYTVTLPSANSTLYGTGATDVAVADGGTGGSTAAAARTNLVARASWGFAYTMAPGSVSTSLISSVANRAVYTRFIDSMASVSKLAVHVSTSSGNISLAVLTGTSGPNPPTSRKATTGSVACPAAGYAETALGSTIAIDADVDWAAISFNGATAAVLGALGAGITATNLGIGSSYIQDTAHPIPTSITGLTAVHSWWPCIVGVA